jgi:serine/threonine-protein phosphatase 2B catalytic subunit
MFPKRIWMLRGNHECRHLTEYFNFREECLYKYNEAVYNAAMDAFDCLPISAVVNGKFLCVHGGLSPDIRVLDDIDKLSRFQEVPREGPFCDLLWADPADDEDNGYEANDAYKGWFFSNEARHCSYKFGAKACQFFLQKNNLTAVIRGHEVKPEGYEMHFKGRGDIPQVFTIFSAPNYCDAYKNKGSCLKIEDNSLNIRQFVWTTHPYYLPNFMDVFSWSLPFVAEKVTSMLKIILSKVTENKKEEAKVALQTQNADRQGLRQKVLAVSRVMKFYRTLQQSQDDIIKLKQLSPDQKLPNGVLAGGKEAIKAALKTFDEAKLRDAESEMYPNSPAVTRNSTMFSLLKESDQLSFLQELNADLNKAEEEDPLALAETPSISVLDSLERKEMMGAEEMNRQPSEGMKSLVGASRKLVNRG